LSLLQLAGPMRNIFYKIGDLDKNLAQIIVAISAGLSLLVPMILLTLISGLRYRLVLISGCVMAFAVSMGLSINVECKDLIGDTSGYTAVLGV
jgi:hypothetical protein